MRFTAMLLFLSLEAFGQSFEILPVTDGGRPPALPAERCKRVRLNEEVIGPARAQSGTQWCYAYVAADLLSAKLGKRVSAADVAITYNDAMGVRESGMHHSEVGGGRPAEAMEFLLEKGACREEDMPSQDYLVRRGASQGEELRLLTLLNEIEQMKKSWDGRPLPSRVCDQLDAVQALFPNLRAEDLFSILRQSGDFEFINLLQTRNCDSRRVRPPKPLEAMSVYGDRPTALHPHVQNRLLDRIDAQLDAGELTGAGLRGDFFRGYDAKAGDHAVSIVGRRFSPQTGACEYLVRNTWGPDCDGNVPCEEGSYWVSEQTFKGKLLQIYYLQDKSPSPPRPVRHSRKPR